MRYPFDPETLDALPEALAELFLELEDTLLVRICTQLKDGGKLNEVSVQSIRALRSHGIPVDEIEQAIQKQAGIADDEMNRLFDDVVERNQQYYSGLADIAKVTEPNIFVDDAAINAIRRQTLDTYRNITASMGFLVDSGRTMLKPAEAYQWALDNAELKVQSGAISYNQAIWDAVRQLSDSGIRTVDYESGHADQVDVAVRRAVMTGVNQVCQRYAEQSTEYLETDLVEVSAHLGARNTGVGPENHESWHGKVYRWNEKPRASEGDYPDFIETTGYGTGPGLGGWNCRHHFSPFIEGVMERTYTDEQLDGMKAENRKITFEVKEYDGYQATQKQRQIERTIRKLKRRREAARAAGLADEARDINTRIRRLNAKYRAFSKAAGLPEQRERMKAYTPGNSAAGTAGISTAAEAAPSQPNTVVEAEKSGIMGTGNNAGGETVHTVGKIDIEKFRVVSDKIRTDEVIITDERIAHIMERHPGDYEQYSSRIKEMVEHPQYILEDKVPDTAVIMNEFTGKDENFRLILKLAVMGDEASKVNSVITFIRISEKSFKKYIRNKKILYKSE